MVMNIFDNTFMRVEQGIERTAKIQTIIAHNISNANNPDFEPLEFDAVLNKAVKRADRGHIVLEEEMADLSRNSLNHAAYVKLLASKINVMRTVAAMGRK